MLKHVKKMGDYFMEHLQKLQKKHSAIVEVRGQGLMIGMELESADAAKQVFQQMLKLRHHRESHGRNRYTVPASFHYQEAAH